MDKLISQQAAIDVVAKWIFEVFGIKESDGTATVFKRLRELPSAQPERKTGRWIPDNTDYYRTKFICSACGESEEVPTTDFGYGTMWDYCPMCGARMAERREDGQTAF